LVAAGAYPDMIRLSHAPSRSPEYLSLLPVERAHHHHHHHHHYHANISITSIVVISVIVILLLLLLLIIIISATNTKASSVNFTQPQHHHHHHIPMSSISSVTALVVMYSSRAYTLPSHEPQCGTHEI
jgi:uncharacterized integral membrane protein